MKKRGTFSLSVNVIIVIILAIVVLVLLIGFIRGSFGKSSKNIAEQLETEREPVTPTTDDPITLSRGYIKTNAGETEVIKIAVLNPTGKNWDRRESLYYGFSGCGASDRICYISDICSGNDDPDCLGNTNRGCNRDTNQATDSVCLLHETDCPEGDEGQTDCGPDNGIDILVKCNNELRINKVSEPKIILSGEIQKFTLILDIKKGVEGNYLCEISVFGNNEDWEFIEGFQKDLRIEVK